MLIIQIWPITWPNNLHSSKEKSRRCGRFQIVCRRMYTCMAIGVVSIAFAQKKKKNNELVARLIKETDHNRVACEMAHTLYFYWLNIRIDIREVDTLDNFHMYRMTKDRDEQKSNSCLVFMIALFFSLSHICCFCKWTAIQNKWKSVGPFIFNSSTLFPSSIATINWGISLIFSNICGN